MTHLERANARLMATFVVGNQLAAEPLGAYLFVAGAAVPFGFDAMTFLVAAALLAAVPGGRSGATLPQGVATASVPTLPRGLRALWERPPLRLLAICLCVMNVLFCAAFATFVLYAQRRLGLDEIGFGTLLSGSARGGLAGVARPAAARPPRTGRAAARRPSHRDRDGAHPRRDPFAGGRRRHARCLRHARHGLGRHHGVASSAVGADRLRGRVGSVFGLLALGGAALGTLAGGLGADATTLTAPFWLAAVGMVVLTATVWRRFTDAALSAPAAGTDTMNGWLAGSARTGKVDHRQQCWQASHSLQPCQEGSDVGSAIRWSSPE